MRLIFLILNFITIPILAEEIGTYYGQTLVKPLGYLSPRPPAHANVIDLGDIKLQFNASQVCGYTDWSTAVIGLPKQILSGKYWNSVGNEIKNKALNSVLAISGALPSMLACAASPNWCAVMNRAEALAQANLKFTFDTCQMLESLSDTTKAQFGPLAGCVKEYVAQGFDQSQALDKCSVGNRDPDGVLSKQKIKEAEKNNKDPYKSESLTARLCQEKAHPRYSSSNHAYTITEFSCNWVRQIIPGISLEGSSKFRHGGTFSNSPVEESYDKMIKESSILLLKILDVMHALRYGKGPYSSQGPQPRHLVVVHKDVRSLLGQRPDGRIIGVCYEGDGPNCKNDISKLPKIYRFSSGTAIPALLISPATLYELVDLIPKDSTPSDEYNKDMSRTALALEPLVRSLSYSMTQDMVKDTLTRLKRTCNDPDFQSQAAQEDCRSRIETMQQEKENLKIRNEEDKENLLAQIRFYDEVEKMKKTKIKVDESSRDKGFSEFSAPNELR